MDREEIKLYASKLRELTGESMFVCRRVLHKFEYDIDKSVAFLKLHYYDSHGFLREREQ